LPGAQAASPATGCRTNQDEAGEAARAPFSMEHVFGLMSQVGHQNDLAVTVSARRKAVQQENRELFRFFL